MAISFLQMSYMGQGGVLPQRGSMVCDDNKATVTSAGYLNNNAGMFNAVYNTGDFIFVDYNGGEGVFSVDVSADGIITLAVAGGAVVTPTIVDHIATYADVNGTLTEDPATAISGGNLQAGLSGTAGHLASFPGTAAKGSLIIAAVANTGNTNTTISNEAMGQATVVSIPDPGASTAAFALLPLTVVSGNIPEFNGTTGVMSDSGIPASNIPSGPAVLLTPSGDQVITADSLTVAAGNFTVSNGNIVGGNNAGAAGALSLLASSADGFLDFEAASGSASGAGMGVILAPLAQGTTTIIPDPGVADAVLPLINAAAVVSGNLPSFNGTTGVLEDSGIPASNVPASAAVLLSPSGDQHITTDDLYLDNGSLNLAGRNSNSIVMNGSAGLSYRNLTLDGGGSNAAIQLNDSTNSKYFQITNLEANLGNFVILQTDTPFAQTTRYRLSDPGTTNVVNILGDWGTYAMNAGASISLDKATGTEAANAVTINKQSGVITSSSLTVTAGSTYVITLTNSQIVSTSVINLQWMGGSNALANFTMSVVPGSGSAVITIYNNDVATSISGTVIIGFAVF